MSDTVPPNLPSSPPSGSAAPEKKKSKFPLGCVIAVVVVFVLIIIIGILAGLMFPAVRGAQMRAESTRAESSCYILKNSMSAFFTEYRKYPVTGNGKDFLAETDSDLMKVLVGSPSSALNPRGIPFYSGRVAKSGGYSGLRQGLNPDPENPELYDPWGTVYRVLFDTDYDNRVESPDESGVIKASILVWSAGPDGDFSTWDDNVKTW